MRQGERTIVQVKQNSAPTGYVGDPNPQSWTHVELYFSDGTGTKLHGFRIVTVAFKEEELIGLTLAEAEAFLKKRGAEHE